MPTDPTPGRSLVTRRALIDMIRAATLGSYGVTGFAASPFERLLGVVGLRQPGIGLRLDDGLEIELDLTVAYGVPIAEVARQVDSAVRYSLRRALVARGRPADDPRRRPPLQPGRRCHRPWSQPARPRSGRATWRTAARTSPDGPTGLRWSGPARRVPRGRRQPRGARRGDQRPQRLSGPGRGHRLEHAGHGPGGPRGGRRCRRPTGRPSRGRHQLRRADGRPRQLGRHHQPDLPGHGRSARRKDPVQRPRPGACPVRGRADGLRCGREAGRGHHPDRDPRIRCRGRDGRGARPRHRVRAGRYRRGGRAIRRADAQPAGDPARGWRGRLGWPGPVPAPPGCPAPCGQADVQRGRQGPVSQGTGRQGVDAGRPRGRGFRLRDDVPAPAQSPRRPRRGRHPQPPRVDRRVGPGGRRRPRAQGPCPQRATGPGHRLRADDRHAEPDQRREPGPPGA